MKYLGTFEMYSGKNIQKDEQTSMCFLERNKSTPIMALF